MNWKEQKTVVTGGAGFIGSHLVRALLARGAHVTVIDDMRRGVRENVPEGAELLVTDVACARMLVASLCRDAVVFHLAARVTNIAANQRDHLGMLQDNLKTNTAMIEAVQLARPRLFVATSTVCVYPHDAPVPTAEEDAFPYHPEDTNEGYGLAKAILEKQAEYLHREHGLPVIVPRFSNAIGERDWYDWESSHVVPALIRKAHEADVIMVWGSGNQTRCFVDAADIAEGLIRLAETPAAHDAQPVNIGHRREISIADLMQFVLELSGQVDKPVRFDRSKPDGHQRRGVDNTRLRALTGWEPPTPLVDTLEKMIEEYRSGRAHL
jgi:GDP-L-fucose synthase